MVVASCRNHVVIRALAERSISLLVTVAAGGAEAVLALAVVAVAVLALRAAVAVLLACKGRERKARVMRVVVTEPP